ncbi:NADH-quinone oxidoreductase subunit C [Shigella flexneri]
MVNNMTDLTAQDAAWQTRDHLDDPVIGELRNRFGPDAFTVQATRTGVPVVWVKREQLLEVGDFLKRLPKPYVMLFDLHGMDERLRTHREGLPAADFSVFYHLISIERNRDIMLKVALSKTICAYRLSPNCSRTPTGMSVNPGKCLASISKVTRT